MSSDDSELMEGVSKAVEMFAEADRQVKHRMIRHYRTDKHGVPYEVPVLPANKYDMLIHMEAREKFYSIAIWVSILLTIFTAGMCVWWGGDDWWRWMLTLILPGGMSFMSIMYKDTMTSRIDTYINGVITEEREAENRAQALQREADSRGWTVDQRHPADRPFPESRQARVVKNIDLQARYYVRGENPYLEPYEEDFGVRDY